MANEVLLSMGSNIGDKVYNLQKALEFLQESGNTLLNLSSYYLTAPWGLKDQEWFINIAVHMAIIKDIHSFHFDCKLIEEKMGKSLIHWGPRKMDIDIIYWSGGVLQSDQLNLPHPRATERMFVLLPIAEIAPDWMDPVFQKKVSELLALCHDEGIVRRYYPGAI
jgi:2-amino-4-hydroxy-6-hydroxymethyldihydropteridine diphosphokinase